MLFVLVIYLLATRIPRIWPSKIVLQMMLVGLFMFLYVVGYGPEYRAESDASISVFHFSILSFYALLAMVLTYSSRNYHEAILFLLAISVGILLHAATVVGFTVYKHPPPYYGNVWNPFSGQSANSPAYSNLAVFFPVVALAFLPILKHRIIGLLLMVILVSISAGIGVLLGGRTFFVALFFALLVGGVLRLGGVRQFIVTSLIAIILIGLDGFLYQVEPAYEAGRDLMLSRFQEKGLQSSRWEMYGAWVEQVMRDPWGRPATPYYSTTPWFHNFWMDIYRDSGLAAFLLSVLIFTLPLTALVKSSVVLRFGAIEKVLLLFPVFAVFLSSIPMLGEKQALLFFFAVSIFVMKYVKTSSLVSNKGRLVKVGFYPDFPDTSIKAMDFPQSSGQIRAMIAGL